MTMVRASTLVAALFCSSLAACQSGTSEPPTSKAVVNDAPPQRQMPMMPSGAIGTRQLPPASGQAGASGTMERPGRGVMTNPMGTMPGGGTGGPSESMGTLQGGPSVASSDGLVGKTRGKLVNPSSIPGFMPPPGAVGLDTAKSSISFVGAKVTGSHTGTFKNWTGWIQLSNGKPAGGKVAVAIEVASLKTEDPKLDGHLRSPDFFDVGEYSAAVFISTDIKAGGANGATHTITGDLEIHGVKRNVSFPAVIKVGAEGVDAAANFSINRKDFNIVYAGMADDLIKDEVVIKLALVSSPIGRQ
jgi:polyisoprenoid-binding protein YceI